MKYRFQLHHLLEVLALVAAVFLLNDLFIKFDKIAIESCPARINTIRSFENKIPETKWEFQLASSFKYTIKNQEETGKGWFVQLQIDKSTLKLGLDVQVLLPELISSREEALEKAHAEICKRVFEGSVKRARDSASIIFANRTFAGEGKTVDEASAQAIEIARSEFLQEYASETQEVVKDVIEIYDFQMKRTTAEPFKTINEAFQIYEKGKPAKV